MIFNRKKNIDPSLSQPLMDATLAGDVARMKELIDAGADVDAMADPTPPAQRLTRSAAATANPPKEFVLYEAALKGNKAAVQLLLDNGAKPDPMTVDNRTPLMVAATWNRLEVAAMLIDAGADIFKKAPSGSPFDRARNAIDGEDMVLMMLGKLDARKQDSLFFQYAAACEIKVMRAFSRLEGFDMNKEDDMGNTALILAAASSREHVFADKVIRLLLKNGADVKAVNHMQETALSAAMTAGPIAREPIRLLLEAGSDIMHKNLAGMTNYDAALLAGNEDLLPLFNAALKKHNLREVEKIHDGTEKDITVKRIAVKPRKPPGAGGP